MNVFVFSDLHGSFKAFKQVIDAFEKEDCDVMLFLGDFLAHGPRNKLPEEYDPQAIAELANKYADKLICVRGNCDAEVDEMLLDFSLLAPYAHLLIDERRIFATHGHIYSKSKMPPLPGDSIFMSGHTHIPVAEKCDGIWHINPGSVSLPKGGSQQSYGILAAHSFVLKTLDGTVLQTTKLI